jgi:hypothetical protein
MLQIVTPRPTNLIGKHKTDAVSAYEAAINNGETPTHLEPPTRVRYPTKRMTIGEMRKRVRNLLEYVGRVQAEEDKRAERAKLLELAVLPAKETARAEDPARSESAKARALENPKTDLEIGKPATLTTEPQPMEVDTASTEPASVVGADAPQGDNVPFTANAITIVDPTTTSADTVMEDTAAAPSMAQDLPPIQDNKSETEPAAIESTNPRADAGNEAVISAPAPAPPAESAAIPTIPPPIQPSTSTVELSTTAPIPPAAEAPPSKSSQLLAELTSDLIKFQMMFEVGGSVFAAPPNGNVISGAADDD